MFADIRHYKFDPKNAREIDQKFREIFVPQIEKIQGLVSFQWIDSGNGEGASYTVCEDQDAVEETVRVAGNFVRQNLGKKISAPQVTSGEVVAESSASQTRSTGQRETPPAREATH